MQICLNINCKKKGELQSLENFTLRKDTGKYRGECKECRGIYNKKYSLDHFEKVSKQQQDWRLNNKDYIKQQNEIYYSQNREAIIIQKREYNNKPETKEQRKRYDLINKEQILIKDRKYYYDHKEERLEYSLAYRLRTGKTTGLGISKGEQKIKIFLEQNQILFKHEEDFNTCKFWFDFFLPEKNLCIEYDGEFHYKSIFGEKRLKEQQNYDLIKTNYCQEQNIKLLRIPYWEKENIEQILTNKL